MMEMEPPNNTVSSETEVPLLILHCLERGKTCPSTSPFVLKLETYLRISKIPYQVDTTNPFGSKGKTPWITLNGEEVSDSQLIIEFLNKQLNKDPWAKYSKAEKAVAQSMRIMLEDHFLYALADWRWVAGIDTLDKIMAGSTWKLWLTKQVVSRRKKKALDANGIGKHSPKERLELLSQDLKALSDYLGTKQFLLGHEPSDIDSTVFGVLAQFVYAAPGSPYEKMIKDDCSNVLDYCERMKALFWPDWEKLLNLT